MTAMIIDDDPIRQTVRFGPLLVDFDRRVLRPRPWTLRQCIWAAELSDGLGGGPILELCAGAGHIGLVGAMMTDRDLVQVEPTRWRPSTPASTPRGRGGRPARSSASPAWRPPCTGTKGFP
jgi:hypothetical protein